MHRLLQEHGPLPQWGHVSTELYRWFRAGLFLPVPLGVQWLGLQWGSGGHILPHHKQRRRQHVANCVTGVPRCMWVSNEHSWTYMYTATDPTLMGTGSCVSDKVNPFTYIVIISAPGKFYCRNKCIYGLLEISVIFNVLMQEPCIGYLS